MAAWAYVLGALVAVAITAIGFLFMALFIYPPTVISRYFVKWRRGAKLAVRLGIACVMLVACGYIAYAAVSRL